MTIELINIGATPNDQSGDPLRTAFGKVNRNFEALQDSSSPGGPDGAVQYRGVANLNAIAQLTGTVVATGYPHRVYTSTDLVTWNEGTSPTDTTFTAVTSDGTQFIAVGNGGTIATSLTGEFWDLQTTGITTDLTGIAWGGGVYIAVGFNGQILRSVDATNWTVETSPTAEHLRSVAYSSYHDAFIATGDSGTIITSPDGIAWGGQTSGITEDLNSVTTYLGLVLIAGNAGRILASLDLFNWDIRTSGTLQNLNGITTATLGTVVTAFAVGASGTVVTSSDAGFITWDDTTYTSPTTSTLIAASTLDIDGTTTVAIIGNGGSIFTTTGGSWNDTGIPAGLDGSANLVFDAQASTLSIAADIVPQTTETWDLGTDTKRWGNAYFSANGGVTIGAVVATEFGNTIHLAKTSNTSVLAGLLAETVTANTITANTSTTTDLTVTDAATIGNLTVTGDTVLANVTVANIVIDQVTANTITANTVDTDTITGTTATFTDRVTANAFYGDGSHLTGIEVKAQGVPESIQFADAYLDFDGTANFTFDQVTGIMRVPAIVTDGMVAGGINATDVTASRLYGNGASITGLPVQDIVAGTNVVVANVGGVWTISASGGNLMPNPSHLPVNSIQIAGPNGVFFSGETFTFDPLTSNVELQGNMNALSVTATTFNGNIIGANAEFNGLSANSIQTGTITGNLTGNLSGNVTGTSAQFTGNVTANNIALTGTITVGNTQSNLANIGNISIFRSNISEFGNGTDNFVISSRVANIIVAAGNSVSSGANAATIDIRGGNALGNAVGGAVTVEAGRGGTQGIGGTLNLLGGAGGTTGGDGGNINILGGNAGSGATGGSINIISGSTTGDPIATYGSNITIKVGDTDSEDAGTLTLQGSNAVGAGLVGGNVVINAGTGSTKNGNIYIGNIRWPYEQGLTNQVMVSDGFGAARWEFINGNTPQTLTLSNIANGTSNVSVAYDGNVTFTVDGTANVMTVTDTTVLANSFTANNFILGDATSTACVTKWVKAQTATTVPNQVLFEMPAASQNSVDFKVIAVDVPTQNKQSSMITTVTYGTSTSYSEYARSVINTVISDLSVDQTGGNIRLLASPRVAYLIRYTVIVSIY